MHRTYRLCSFATSVKSLRRIRHCMVSNSRIGCYVIDSFPRNPGGFMSSLAKMLSFVAAAFAGATVLMAQFDSGQISGFVRDPSGAVVPSATVVTTNAGTKEPHRTTTNGDGYFKIEGRSE